MLWIATDSGRESIFAVTGCLNGNIIVSILKSLQGNMMNKKGILIGLLVSISFGLIGMDGGKPASPLKKGPEGRRKLVEGIRQFALDRDSRRGSPQSINRLGMRAIREDEINEERINTPDASGRTLLHQASFAGNVGMVRRLLALGARTDVNTETAGDDTRQGGSVLLYALWGMYEAVWGGTSIVEARGTPTKPSVRIKEDLSKAQGKLREKSVEKFLDVIGLLLEHDRGNWMKYYEEDDALFLYQRRNREGLSPIVFAARAGLWEAVEFISEFGIDDTEEGYDERYNGVNTGQEVIDDLREFYNSNIHSSNNPVVLFLQLLGVDVRCQMVEGDFRAEGSSREEFESDGESEEDESDVAEEGDPTVRMSLGKMFEAIATEEGDGSGDDSADKETADAGDDELEEFDGDAEEDKFDVSEESDPAVVPLEEALEEGAADEGDGSGDDSGDQEIAEEEDELEEFDDQEGSSEAFGASQGDDGEAQRNAEEPEAHDKTASLEEKSEAEEAEEEAGETGVPGKSKEDEEAGPDAADDTGFSADAGVGDVFQECQDSSVETMSDEEGSSISGRAVADTPYSLRNQVVGTVTWPCRNAVLAPLIAYTAVLLAVLQVHTMVFTDQ